MVETIKKACYKAVEWQMLRVYAVIMTETLGFIAVLLSF